MEQRCAHCAHLGVEVVVPHEDAEGGLLARPTGHYLCTAVRHAGALHVGPENAATDAPDERLRQPAWLGDSAGHAASLCVSPDFGCVRWHPRA